jgi:hypothetical protein
MNKKMLPTRHIRALQILHVVWLKSLEVVLKSFYLTPIYTLAKSQSHYIIFNLTMALAVITDHHSYLGEAT